MGHSGRSMNVHEVDAAIRYPWRFTGISPQSDLEGNLSGRWYWSATCERIGHRYHAKPLIRMSGEDLIEAIRASEAQREDLGDAETPVYAWGTYEDRGGWWQAWAKLPHSLESLIARAQTRERALDKLRTRCLHSGYVLAEP